MSAHDEHHVIELDSDGYPRFRCTAPPEASCRNYPACECESAYDHDEADPEHQPVPQDECWLVGWLDDLTDTYAGPGFYALPEDIEEGDTWQPWRAGPISHEWDGDCVTWVYPDEEPT